MKTYLAHIAFGWLTAGGVLHFLVDVVSQYVRGKRPPGDATTLYYGLNTAFALGQVLFGLLCLWLAWRQPDFLANRMITALCVAGGAGWLVITYAFMEYREPKIMAMIFLALLIAAIVAARPIH